MSNHAVMGIIGIGAILTLAACSSTVSPPTASDSPIAVYSDSVPGGDAAALTGTLSEEDGCLYILSSNPSERWIPVFRGEDGPKWEDGTFTFAGISYDGSLALTMGGSEGIDLNGNYDIPSACDDSPKWQTWEVHT